MRAIICTGPRNYNIRDLYNPKPDDFIIGADSGAMILAENEIQFHLALGDFDSVTKEEVECIKKYAENVEDFPIKKDFTDTHLAINKALDLGCDEIIIFGGIGKRIDHTLANITLLTLGNIKMISDEEELFVLNPGSYDIFNNHKYISFFALEEVKGLNLAGFEYPLSNHTLEMYSPLCVSNKGSGMVSFDVGKLLVIKQNEN